ncbi:hypothetical protein GCM10022251_61350 [Phytohabitans flavus]|uniref:Uncharacterized protein n=1 Tax=Phytohabitans flavus TaxID=1076124 RepID=A0A6F8Y4J7_9ACTN|nr:hypothetical protein Pflav_074350 [Phytohabitans flavus]
MGGIGGIRCEDIRAEMEAETLVRRIGGRELHSGMQLQDKADRSCSLMQGACSSRNDHEYAR